MKFTPHPNFGQIVTFCVLGLLALFGSGCHTSTPLPKYVTEFYMEAPNPSGVAFTLPISQLIYHRMADSFLDLSMVTGVDQGHVTLNLPDGSSQAKACVIFYLNDDGRERLNMASAANPQRRIFLFLNEKPIGVRPIDQPIESGQLFMFMEVTDKDLPTYVADLKESIKRFKDLKNK
jgi:hypothetical protein